MPLYAPARAPSEVLTARLDGTDVRYVATLGQVANLITTDTMPGGNEQMTCSLQKPPHWRDKALDPARLVRVIRGGSIQWEGILDEPTPTSQWDLTARGAGTWGSLYQAVYGTWSAADIIANAAGRGLGWYAGNLGTGYLAEQHDSGSMTVTDFLNLYTQPGSQTWRVRRTFSGNQLDVYPIPTAVTRLLITTVPAARTLAGYINALWIRYQATADAGKTPATYGLTSATLPASIAAHGRQEAYWDISQGGVMTAAAAQSLGNSALAKYTAASWSGPFQVAPGQYLTAGGVPVDHGCEHAGEVVRLIMADGPYGGEVSPAPPVQFPVGKVEYHQADGTLLVTPLQAWTADLSAITQWLTPLAPPAKPAATTTTKR